MGGTVKMHFLFYICTSDIRGSKRYRQAEQNTELLTSFQDQLTYIHLLTDKVKNVIHHS